MILLLSIYSSVLLLQFLTKDQDQGQDQDQGPGSSVRIINSPFKLLEKLERHRLID